MNDLNIIDARIVTLRGPSMPRRGSELGEVDVIEQGHVLVRNGRISAMGPGEPDQLGDEPVVNADGNVLMPAFVDCHTHACWAGNRYDEWRRKLAGATYLELLESGGGIMSTVRAVREAEEDELTAALHKNLLRMVALGTGTVEIKSGYGLSTEHELKMLRAIHNASRQSPLAMTGTFLGAHAIDPDNPKYVDQTIEETLPAVAEEFYGIVCDAYCEQGAWSLEDTRRLFEKASDLGCPLRVHTDQFNSLGATAMAIEMGAVSADHLEATTPDELKRLAESNTIGVMLPVCGFHLDGRFGPARTFVDAGGALALATNFNPGSAPSPSMPFVIALACREMGLTPAEAIMCCTHNAACVLGVQDELGSIDVGRRAHLQLLDTRDECALAHDVADAGPLLVLLDGVVIHARAVVLGEEESEDETDE